MIQKPVQSTVFYMIGISTKKDLKLTRIMNDRSENDTFPDGLKNVKTAPCFKKGYMNENKNNCLVSIFSRFSKVFMRLNK